ncbi:MAG: DNA-3-methyladenine glycosylase 2 family protein [Clostridia bacterium]|nr:DNA-3-methyladenine glycosylase 2 family protein [Clostridia bacterium]
MVFFTPEGAFIENDGYYDFDKIFDCGQCFRFEKTGDTWRGVAFGRVLRVRVTPEGGTLLGVGREEYDSVWRVYFDADTDYSAVNAALSRDAQVADALNYARGIRILRQDKWETLCSFIISQNNNIPRIKKIVSSLCANFGERIGESDFAFPTSDAVAQAGEEGLAVIRSGFRAKYIADAARRVESGDVDLGRIDTMDYEEAKEYLMRIKGVGNKVADCVLLFGYGFFDAFPKDVWIKRVIEKYYGDTFDETVFAPYGGIAQQYLFYRERYKTSPVNA